MDVRKLAECNQSVSELFDSVEGSCIDECRCIFLKPKEALIRSMEPTKCMWYLASGEMWAFNDFLNGRRYSTERIIKGSYIGEMELVAKYPHYISNVSAVTLCMLIEVPEEIYRFWFEQYADFARGAAVRFARSLCRNAVSVGVNNMLSSGEAVCLLLCNLYRERQHSGENVLIKETRQGLADHAGVSLRSVNRAISALSTEKIIEMKKGKVVMSSRSYELLRRRISKLR